MQNNPRGDFGPGSGHISCVERGPDGRPLRFVAEVTGSLGRKLAAEGVSRNMLNWQGYCLLVQWWPLVEWEFDGATAYGEGQDHWPLRQARTYARSSR